MPAFARVILLVSAALCGGFSVLQGAAVSWALEPYRHSACTAFFWIAVGSILTAPLWVPAIIPSRFPVALRRCRRMGAVALLYPTYMFASIVIHDLSRMRRGFSFSRPALIQGSVLTGACLVCLFILLWPELKALAQRLRGVQV